MLIVELDSTRRDHPYGFALGMYVYEGTAVAQWLRCCAENRKVAGSRPAGVIGIFH